MSVTHNIAWGLTLKSLFKQNRMSVTHNIAWGLTLKSLFKQNRMSVTHNENFIVQGVSEQWVDL